MPKDKETKKTHSSKRLYFELSRAASLHENLSG